MTVDRRPPQIAVRVTQVPSMDAYDVFVFRYNYPAEGLPWAEVLTDDGWVKRGWPEMACSTLRIDGLTLRIDGLTLHFDKPLDIAVRGLAGAERDHLERIEQVVESSVMRALAGTPAWFPVHERSDGTLTIVLKPGQTLAERT